MDQDTQGQQAGTTQPPATPTPAPVAAPHNRTLMGILSYLGILVIIPFLMAKSDPFVKFHVKQGLVLAIIGVAVWFIGMNMWSMWSLVQIINLGVIILSIIGIVNVVGGHQKEIPLVGSLAKHFNF